MRRPRGVGKYAYVLLQGDCPMCDENIIYCSNEKIPGHEVMILMLENGSFGCEVYETNFSYDRNDWKNISKFGSLMSDLF